MWRQEMANVKKDKNLSTTMDLIVKSHKSRVAAIGGTSKLCQVYIGRGISHQKKLFINVSGLPG